MAFTKSQEACTISKSGLEYLCGLIRDINGLDTNLIDDINIKSNGSYSSLKISQLVDQILKDSKDYTDLLCSSLIKLTCEKTTVQPTLSNSQLNVIYLYSSDGNAPFEQFLKISDTELIDMGSTSISLNDYLTITDAVATYCKKTDFDALKTTVNNIKTDIGTEDISSVGTSVKEAINTLNTNKEEKSNKVTTLDSTSTDTQYPSALAVKTELDKKIDKTSITDTIDSTSTSTDIASAKAVYDNAIKDKNINTYTDINQLGLTVPCAVGDIFNALPNFSLLRFQVDNYSVTDAPYGNGILIIDKIRSAKFSIEFKPSADSAVAQNYLYIGQLKGSDVSGLTWSRLCSTGVKDVEKTNIKFSSTTNYEIVGNNCQYFIKNGICTMLLYVKCNVPINEWTTVSNVPKPLNLNKYDILGSIDGDGILKCVVNTSGLLQFSKGVSGTSYIGTISYPVAES